MDAEATKLLATALAIGIGAIGPELALSYWFKAVEAIGRNPEAQSSITTTWSLCLHLQRQLPFTLLLLH